MRLQSIRSTWQDIRHPADFCFLTGCAQTELNVLVRGKGRELIKRYCGKKKEEEGKDWE